MPDLRLVFDPVLWGGRDVGDNSQFRKVAEILDISGSGRDEVATVRFLHDGRMSRGHFTDCMHPMPALEDK